MREYKCLSKQTYTSNEYQIVPIRDEDKYDIMQWRNEQIYHLRQSKPLDKESQDYYFKNVIASLFEKAYPDQILFSYLENEKCPVFCLQVPSEVFYVRRNGKACWTGNSRASGHVTTLTRQPLEGNVKLIMLVNRKNKNEFILLLFL